MFPIEAEIISGKNDDLFPIGAFPIGAEDCSRNLGKCFRDLYTFPREFIFKNSEVSGFQAVICKQSPNNNLLSREFDFLEPLSEPRDFERLRDRDRDRLRDFDFFDSPYE